MRIQMKIQKKAITGTAVHNQIELEVDHCP